MADPTQRGAVVTASDAAAYDYFGSSSSISGNGLVLAVGAIWWEGAFSNQGGVYVYDKSGDSWSPRGGVLTAPDAGGNNFFGSSVALSTDGSVLVVGAYAWSGTYVGQGGVYTFDWNGSAWVQRGAVLTAGDAIDESARFGESVALSADGSVLVVGAPYRTVGTIMVGGVYVYDLSGGAWVQRGTTMPAPSLADYSQFGNALAVSSSAAVLAVNGDGGVYTFDWSGSAWVQRDFFLEPALYTTGVSLSGSGSRLAVGIGPRDLTYTSQGSVFVYDSAGTNWVLNVEVVAGDAAGGDYFGQSVAMSGELMLVVGAIGWDGVATDQGGVYVFDFAAPLPSIFWTNFHGQHEAA